MAAITLTLKTRWITRVKIRWPRKLNMLQIEKKQLQIKKTVHLFVWLCCEHLQCVSCFCCELLQQLLSNWCFLDLLALFLFACVFWSCSDLTSLGHCIKGHNKTGENNDKGRQKRTQQTKSLKHKTKQKRTHPKHLVGQYQDQFIGN